MTHLRQYNVIVSSTPLPGKIEVFPENTWFSFCAGCVTASACTLLSQSLIKILNSFLRDEKTGDECFQFLVYYMNAKY